MAREHDDLPNSFNFDGKSRPSGAGLDKGAGSHLLRERSRYQQRQKNRRHKAADDSSTEGNGLLKNLLHHPYLDRLQHTHI